MKRIFLSLLIALQLLHVGVAFNQTPIHIGVVSSSGASANVQSVSSISDINTPAGISFYNLSLPANVQVTLSNGNTPTYAITWAQGSYDYVTVGTYNLTGALTLPTGVTNTSLLTAEVDVTVSWSPFVFNNDIVFYAPTWMRSTMMEETGFLNPAITTVTSTSDPIGFGYSMGPNSFIYEATSDGTRPTLGSSGGWVFDGTDDRLTIPQSVKTFKDFYKPSPAWTVACFIDPDTDGTSLVFINSTNGSGANNGISLTRNTSNGISVRLSVGGLNLTTFNTTGTVTAAAGKVSVIVTLSGTALSVYIGALAAETATVTNLFANADMSFDLVWGALANGTQGFDGIIYDPIILNRVMTSGERSDYRSFNPSVIDTEFPPIQEFKIDPNNTSDTWENVAKTITATNGNVVAYIDSENKLNFGDPYLRHVKNAASGEKPILVTNDINGRSSLSFDATNDKLVLARPWEKGGKYTMFIIAKYDDDFSSTLGNSHILFGGGMYFVITGQNYSGNTSPGQSGNPYCVVHPSDGSVISVDCFHLNNGYNLFVFVRNGGVGFLVNGNKDEGDPNISVLGSYSIANIGSDTTFKFKIAVLLKFNGIMPTPQRNVVINSFNSQFGL